jgi:oligoribonuclease NrnB/cAMP/cGMP phosphodiesterase (DHH superfamily)
LKKIAKKAKYVLFIDHHITIRDDILDLQNAGKNLKVIYDEYESGASLVWKYCFPKLKMPKFVELIKDNDIGTWKLPNTLPFMSALEVNFTCEPTFENLQKWDNLLLDDYLSAMIERGKVYDEYKSFLIKKQSHQITTRFFPSIKIIDYVNKNYKDKHNLKEGMYKVSIVDGGCPSTSLLGKYIAENTDCDFCLLYHYNMNKKIYIISLRSKSTNIGEIAKYLGGGGHKLAAAFSVSSNDFHIDDLFVDLFVDNNTKKIDI